MGLQAWYPLINDMRNQGVGDTDLVVETTPTFGAGKIGNALISGGNSHWTAAQSEKVLNNNAISICFWVYVDAPEGDKNKRAMFFGNDGKRNYSLFQYPSCNDFHWSWYSYDSSSTGTFICGGTLSGALPSYKWTHVAITYSNPNGAIYINGEKKQTFSGVMNNYTFSNQTPVIYQCEYRKLNDFRIYDHALSPREVKELSKGLVLHYPLSGSGGGCENLMKDSNFSITSGSNASTVKIATLIPVGTTITVSVQVDADDVVWDSSSNYQRVGTEFYAQKSGTTGNQYFGAWAGQELSSSANVVEAFTGSFHGRISKTFTTLGEVPALRNVGLYIQGVTSGTVRVSNPKVEIGSVATPWIPNVADAEYATMGFNDGIEYDVSGYGHNGTKTGTFAYDADTPRYETSTIFNGNNHIAVGRLLITDELTYSWWAYSDNWGSSLGGSMVSSVESGGMGHQNAGSAYLWFICGTGTSSNDYGSGYQMPTPSAGWHMFTETWDGYRFKVYLDGELKYTNERYTTKTPVYYSQSYNFLFLGGESGGSATTPGDHFIGKLSDARVYATALSADDILELYHTPETLSHNGTLLTQGEFVES